MILGFDQVGDIVKIGWFWILRDDCWCIWIGLKVEWIGLLLDFDWMDSWMVQQIQVGRGFFVFLNQFLLQKFGFVLVILQLYTYIFFGGVEYIRQVFIFSDFIFIVVKRCVDVSYFIGLLWGVYERCRMRLNFVDWKVFKLVGNRYDGIIVDLCFRILKRFINLILANLYFLFNVGKKFSEGSVVQGGMIFFFFVFLFVSGIFFFV